MSKKLFLKIMFLIFIVFALITIYLVHRTESQMQSDMYEISSQLDDVDEMFYDEYEEWGSDNLTWDLSESEDLLEEDEDIDIHIDDIAVWEDDIDIDSLDTSRIDDIWYIEILEALYEQDWSIEVLSSLIDLLVDNYMFEDAFNHLYEIYLDEWLTYLDFDPNLVLYVFINSIDFTRSNISTFQSLVDEYYEEEMISETDYIFYEAIVDLIHMNFDNFISKVNSISNDPNYDSLNSDLEIAIWQYHKFKDAPDYYKQWLVSFVLLQHWYFSLAERVAERTLRENSNYILANQVIWYSNFVLWNADTSNKYFDKLLNIDSWNSDTYNFYMWTNYFWQWRNQRAIGNLSQVNEWNYKKDAIRYLSIAYYNIDDNDRMIDSFEKLLNLHRPLNEFDYYTFFDFLFYSESFFESDFSLFFRNTSTVREYITACYQDLEWEELWVCRYARAWLHFAREEYDIAYRYLRFISQEYPRDYIFRALGDYYYENGQLDDSRRHYLKAIAYSDDWEFRESTRWDLLDVLIEIRWD